MNKIRAFVVDDGALYRTVMADVLASFDDVEVTGSASGADIAVERLERAPVDVVFCDVHMPGKNGVDALIEIRRLFPRTVVIMMSGISSRNAPIVIRALQMGALDFIAKPDGATLDENVARLKEGVASVLPLVRIRLNLSSSEQQTVRIAAAARTAGVAPTVQPADFAVVAIGISTGGPEALSKLVPALPPDLPSPVLVVQHMPEHFTMPLVESLARKSKIRVVEAQQGEAVEPATVYFAPGGRHMTVHRVANRMEVGLNDGPAENSCRPSVDVLFRSVGVAYGDQGIIAVVMTGMGSDGLLGVRALKRRGCCCITQRADSCAVFGMPRTVEEAGLSDKSLDINGIAAEILSLLRYRMPARLREKAP